MSSEKATGPSFGEFLLVLIGLFLLASMGMLVFKFFAWIWS